MRLLGIVELSKSPKKMIVGYKACYGALWYEVRAGFVFVRGEGRIVDREMR